MRDFIRIGAAAIAAAFRPLVVSETRGELSAAEMAMTPGKDIAQLEQDLYFHLSCAQHALRGETPQWEHEYSRQVRAARRVMRALDELGVRIDAVNSKIIKGLGIGRGGCDA